jgi:hypothetical protein
MAAKRFSGSIKEQVKASEYKRAWSLWSSQEDTVLLQLYQDEKLSVLDIAKKLERTVGSIDARLSLLGVKKPRVPQRFGQFLAYLEDGINPITGEILSDDSAWRHPTIIEDLKHYLGHERLTGGRFPQTASVHKTTSDEQKLLEEIFNLLHVLLPRESERNIKIIRHLFPTQGGKKPSLVEVAEKFGISRERVRQIKEKVFRKLLSSVRRKLTGQTPSRVEKVPSFSREKANEYMSMVFDKILEDIAGPQIGENEIFLGGQISNISTEHSSNDIIRSKSEQFVRTPNQWQTQFIVDNENQIVEKEFFRIEKFDAPASYRKQTLILSEFLRQENIDARRIENCRNGRLLNYFFPITVEEVEKMKELFFEGKTPAELEAFFQRSYRSVYQCLEDEGVVVPRASDEEVNAITLLRGEGRKLDEIAVQFGRSPRSVRLILGLENSLDD